MKNQIVLPIQESDLPFPNKEYFQSLKSFKIGDPEKTFHKIHNYGNEVPKHKGLFESEHPFVLPKAFKYMHETLPFYREKISRMLFLPSRLSLIDKWKTIDDDSAKELSLKWVNSYTQNHFFPTISLILNKLKRKDNLKIVELGTGTGLFTLILVDQLLKNGVKNFTLVTGDINRSCIALAWMFKQYFCNKEDDIHSYIFSQKSFNKGYLEAVNKKHGRSIIFVISEFSELVRLLPPVWANLFVSNHATSYLNNTKYKQLLTLISKSMENSSIFVEDSLNEYKLDVRSDRLKSRVIKGGNRKRGKYETEYTVIQFTSNTPTIVDLREPNIDKACDWIRVMTFNPTFKEEFKLFKESLGKTQRTQRNLTPVVVDHHKAKEELKSIGLHDITPETFKTDLYITTKIFQKK